MIVGVDADWYDTAPEYKEVILTSVLKRVDVAVFNSSKMQWMVNSPAAT